MLNILLFFLITIFFGFVALRLLLKIRSILFLIPLSYSLGISFYLFSCHLLSYLFGPQKASFISLLILLFLGLVILIFNFKDLKIDFEVKSSKVALLCLITMIISILTYLSISRFGVFDKEVHIPFALTIYHNNIYPPRDPFRPQYILLYHFGGDLLAGAINHLSKINIYTAYELIASLSAGITFLSYFALSWVLTKQLRLSFIAGFCSYFGGGLLWLDSIIKYLTNSLPSNSNNSILQTFLNTGIHGGIYNAPSICTFVPTFNLGNPILILCLILFWKMFSEKTFKIKSFYILFLSISLFSLFLSAEWLFVTFWAGVVLFIGYAMITRQKQYLLPSCILFIFSILLAKTAGNALFLQDEYQTLGRINIFIAAIKENLFWIISWGKTGEKMMQYHPVCFFSWDCLSELGLSIFLLPCAIIYLIKSKNMLAIFLFSISVITMPVPLIIDFKINPVDLNRFFAFGNTLNILLITYGVSEIYKSFLKNKLAILIYILTFCLSPLSELIIGATFTPHLFLSQQLAQITLNELSKVKSPNDLKKIFNEIDSASMDAKESFMNNHKKTIGFLKGHSKPGDVAIGDLFESSLYSGVYTLIPSNRRLYKDLLYSSYDSIFPTVLSTLAPGLLKELNVRWLVVSTKTKTTLSEETLKRLSNEDYFKLSFIETDKTSKEKYTLYHVEDKLYAQQEEQSQTYAWLLVNQQGRPAETIYETQNKITLFPTFRETLSYLKELYKINPGLKKELITAQTIDMKSLEKQITASGLNISLEKRF